jgi:hypothetical protein
MINPKDSKTCPKCLSVEYVKDKALLIGAASPRKIFGAEVPAGYKRKDQLAVDECKNELLQKKPLQQFISGYYCEACGIGFVSDEIKKDPN